MYVQRYRKDVCVRDHLLFTKQAVWVLKSKIFGQQSTYSKKTSLHSESFWFLFSINKNNILWAHILLKLFFDNFNFWTALFSKIMPNFWQTVSGWIQKVQWFPLSTLIFVQRSCFLGPRHLVLWKVNNLQLIHKYDAVM